MIELKPKTTDSSAEERVELFSLNGTVYTIPAKPRVHLALRYLFHAKRHGVDQAAAELLESLIGPEGFEALTNYEDLTPEELQAVMDAAQAVTLGALEEATGN